MRKLRFTKGREKKPRITLISDRKGVQIQGWPTPKSMSEIPEQDTANVDMDYGGQGAS